MFYSSVTPKQTPLTTHHSVLGHFPRTRVFLGGNIRIDGWLNLHRPHSHEPNHYDTDPRFNGLWALWDSPPRKKTCETCGRTFFPGKRWVFFPVLFFGGQGIYVPRNHGMFEALIHKNRRSTSQPPKKVSADFGKWKKGICSELIWLGWGFLFETLWFSWYGFWMTWWFEYFNDCSPREQIPKLATCFFVGCKARRLFPCSAAVWVHLKMMFEGFMIENKNSHKSLQNPPARQKRKRKALRKVPVRFRVSFGWGNHGKFCSLIFRKLHY